MGDGELQEAPGLQDAIGFGERPIYCRDVHQAHECGAEVKCGAGERQFQGARDQIFNVQRFLFLG
jgi:hypothetical protein